MDQAQSLREMVKRTGTGAMEAPPAAARRETLAKIVAIASGKGGVGKSILTVNLALALRRLGFSVLIIDADFGLANIDVMLGMPARYNLSHLLNREHTLPEIVQEWQEGIHFISGGSGLNELLHMNDEQLSLIISDLLAYPAQVDIILCDTGAGAGDTVLRMTAAATETIIVTTPEPTAILDAYALVKSISQNNDISNIRLVMNKAASAKEAENAINSFLRITKKYLDKQIEPLGSILYDEHMDKSIKLQTPLLLGQPKSLTAKTINTIAQTLVAMPVEKKPGGPLAKLFSRWLNQT